MNDGIFLLIFFSLSVAFMSFISMMMMMMNMPRVSIIDWSAETVVFYIATLLTTLCVWCLWMCPVKITFGCQMMMMTIKVFFSLTYFPFSLLSLNNVYATYQTTTTTANTCQVWKSKIINKNKKPNIFDRTNKKKQ